MEFFPRDGVLSEGRVGFPEQDEDGLDAGSDGLFEAASVGDVQVDVVVDVNAVWCGYRVSGVVVYARIQGVPDCGSEAGCMATSKGATPLDFIENCLMLFCQGGVEEELLGEG